MDQTNFKLPKPSLSSIMIAVALGVVVAVLVYQAQVRGFLSGKGIELPKPPEETRTILKEENAVISAVEKTPSSFVVSDKGITEGAQNIGFAIPINSVKAIEVTLSELPAE